MSHARGREGGRPRVVLFGAVAGGAAACDLLSKWLAFRFLDLLVPMEVVPGLLRLRTSYNQGAVFGIGQGLTPVFVGLTIVAAGAVVWALVAYGRSSRVLTAGLGLLLGGAMGNLWDRLVHGSVRDFIDLYVGRFHWPTFNLADMAICAGAALIVIHAFRSPEASREGRGSTARP